MDEQQQPAQPASTPSSGGNSRLESLRSQLSNVQPSNLEQNSSSNTTEKLTADRGTQLTADKPDTSNNSNQNQPAGDDKSDAGLNASATASTAEPKQKEVKQIRNRAQERIQELAEEVKRLKEAQAPKADGPQAPEAKPEIPKVLPPPANKSPYPRQELVDLKFEALKNQDWSLLRQVEGELAKHDQFDRDMTSWEYKNGAAWNDQQRTVASYREQIFTKWPEFKDTASVHSQEYQKVHSRFVEMQKNPALLEYELASIAALRVRANGAAALEQQNKQLLERLDKYEKRSQPMKQVESTANVQPGSESRKTELKTALRDMGKQLQRR